MIGCAKESDCVIEWFHLNCVGFSRVPAGEWYCDKCLEDNVINREVCYCRREINLDETIICASRKCIVTTFHLCCVNIEDKEAVDLPWYCPECQ